MITNQNILVVLRIFSTLQKINMQNFTQKETTFKPATTKFLAKLLTERKYLLKKITFVRRDVFR